MFDLILDIKIYIASFDEKVWIKLTLYDEEFKQYTITKTGINQFVNYFHYKINNDTYLFHCLHSIDDKPAVIRNYKNEWCYQNELHRENDLPAAIYNNNAKAWYYYGKLHRENDLPAIIQSNGDKLWYYHGDRHRANNLPTFIKANGDKY